MRTRIVLGIVTLMTSSLLAAPPTKILTPGMWEITMRTVSPRTAPATTIVRCISAEEAQSMKAPESQPTDDCQVTGGVTGSVLAYTVKCASRNIEAQTRYVFNGDRYEGSVEITEDGRSVRQVYTAKRVGECPAAPRPEVER
jgi:hypothetical protein